jgi:hypothetical protein
MTSIWRQTGDTWSLITSQALPDEQTLHDMIERAPQMLPLSGNPRLVIVGREVLLDGNYADLVGVEPDGTIAIIEIKLAKNPEARRAVVAQILTYAASLARFDRQTLETHASLLQGYLGGLGVSSLAEAVRLEEQGDAIEPTTFANAVDVCLQRGAFRLVLVLDAAPSELVRLVGYLETVTNGLIIDLVTVTAFDINGSRIVVPQRVDPSRHDLVGSSAPKAGTVISPPAPTALEGVEPFMHGLASRPSETQTHLAPLVEWANVLVTDGLAEAKTTIGVNRSVLNLRVPGHKVGLVSLYDDSLGYLTLYRSVFMKLAPASIPDVEETLGDDTLGNGTTTRTNTPELLAALRNAYSEASGGQKLTSTSPYFA